MKKLTVGEKIKELGGSEPQFGIAWTWTCFYNEACARRFIQWLEENGFEHGEIRNPLPYVTENWTINYRLKGK